jgi:RHS repeat-associated protein
MKFLPSNYSLKMIKKLDMKNILSILLVLFSLSVYSQSTYSFNTLPGTSCGSGSIFGTGSSCTFEYFGGNIKYSRNPQINSDGKTLNVRVLKCTGSNSTGIIYLKMWNSSGDTKIVCGNNIITNNSISLGSASTAYHEFNLDLSSQFTSGTQYFTVVFITGVRSYTKTFSVTATPQPNLTMGSNISFGTTTLYSGWSYNGSFSVTNTGNAPWSGSMYVSLSNSSTALDLGSATIAAGATKTYTFNYAPSGSGTVTATAKYNNGSGSGITVPNQTALSFTNVGNLAITGNAANPSTGIQNSTNFSFSASISNDASSPAPTVDIEFTSPDNATTLVSNISRSGSNFTHTRTLIQVGTYYYKYIVRQGVRPIGQSTTRSLTVTAPAPPTIASVTTPPNNTWGFGQSKLIQWTTTNGGCGPYIVEVSTNGGTNWVEIGNSITVNSMNWTVGKDISNNPIPNMLNNPNLRLKVYCTSNTSVSNQTANFSLAVPNLIVQTPPALTTGQTNTLYWTLDNAVCSNFTIELSPNGAAPWSVLKTNHADSPLSWTVPLDQNAVTISGAIGSTTNVIKVYCTGYSTINGSSGNISITNPIPVTTISEPLENYAFQKIQNSGLPGYLPIRWNTTNWIGNINMELRRVSDNGLVYELPSQANDGIYDWEIHSSIPAGEYKLLLYPVGTTGMGAHSKNFKILVPPGNLTPAHNVVVTQLTGINYTWNKNNPDGLGTYELRIVDITNAASPIVKINYDNYGDAANFTPLVIYETNHKYRWVVRIKSGVNNQYSESIASEFTVSGNPNCPNCFIDRPESDFVFTGNEGFCAAQYLCGRGIIKNTQAAVSSAPTAILKRLDAANLLVRAVLTDAQIPGYNTNPGNVALPTRQNVTPFEDLNNTNDPNADEQAAKVLIYLSYADDQNSITPFRKSGINFYPNNGIARVDYLKLIMETFNINPSSTQALVYTDITNITGRPLLYIKKARELNLIVDQALFRPYDNVTREEAFLILARLRKNHPQFIRGKEALENTSNYVFEQNVTYNTASVMRSMASGNFAYSENGFAIPDKGLPLSFGFTYSSVITGWPDVYRKVEPLGVGWTHNFNSYILPTDRSVYGDNNVQVGQALLLLANGDGTFHTYDNTNNASPVVRSIDDFNTMVVSQTAGVVSKYEVKRPDQVVFTYEKVNPTEPIFRLTQIADRYNNKLTLTYKAANTAANSDLKVVLDKVTAQSGRYITFNYDSFDKITAVVYPSENTNSYERQLRFGYYAAWDETRSERLEKFWTARHTGAINATRYKYGINQAGAGTTPAKKQIYMLQEIIRPKNNRLKVAYNKDNKIEQLEEGKDGSSAITDKTTFDRSGGCPAGTSTGVNCTIVKGSDGIEYKHFTNDKEILYQITSDVFTLKRPEYDASPRNPSWMSVNGLKHGYAYNAKGQMTLDSTFDKNGTLKHVQKWQYDDAANLWKYWEPNSDLNGDPIIEYNYSADKKYLLSMLQRVNSTTTLTQTFGQAANGQLDYIINAENLRTNFFYNPYGNVDHIQYVPLNLHSYATYDFSSRIKTSTNAKNQVSQVFFDKNDNIVRTVTPAPQNYQTIYRYDANDNPIEIENAKGKITYLTYDKYDRDSTITFGGATQKYYYNNNAASVNFGKITQILKPGFSTDASRKFDFVYDTEGFLESNGYIQNITYKKSAAGLNPPDENTMLSIRGGTNPSHQLSGFVYDDMVRMSEYKDNYNNIVKYSYYPDGKLFRITYPGNKYVDYFYDRAGRLTLVKWNTTTTVASYVYVGSRLDYVQYGNGVRTKYNYDVAGRFAGLSTKKSSGTGDTIADYSYEFDNLGNHVGENITEPYPAPTTPAASTTTYTFNPENNQLSGINGAPVAHDGDGNVITKGNKTYVYDLEDNLKQILENGVSIATFEYDAFGNRRMAIRNGVQTRYVLDLLGMADVLAETDASNNIINYYIHGLGLVARAKPDGSLHYYHGDFRGSVIAMTDASQTITHKYQYDEYGILLNSQEADANPFRYVGLAGILHEAGDLTYMRARYYDPTTGRFNSTDPIWSTNLYPYAGNNPVMGIDPTGEWVHLAVGAVIGGVFGAIKAYNKKGEDVTFNDILLGFGTGAAQGALTVLLPGGALMGAAIAGLGSVVDNMIYDNGNISYGDLAANMALGGILGGVGSKITTKIIGKTSGSMLKTIDRRFSNSARNVINDEGTSALAGFSLDNLPKKGKNSDMKGNSNGVAQGQSKGPLQKPQPATISAPPSKNGTKFNHQTPIYGGYSTSQYNEHTRVLTVTYHE